MRTSLVVGMFLVAAPLAAQTTVPAGADEEVQAQRRYQMRVLESVLVGAVQHAADVMGRRVQAMAPDVVLISGTPRARGFVLPDYGVFFDVEVPGLPLSMAWSMRVIERDLNIGASLAMLRRHFETLADAQARQEVDQALRRIELEVGPAAPPGPAAARRPGAGTVSAATVDAAPTVASRRAEDPGEQYTTLVKDTLVEAMLDYSGRVGVGADEWLTVAARDGHGPLVPGEIYDAVTVVLRIRGRDLAEHRAGRITRDEAIRRVEVRQF